MTRLVHHHSKRPLTSVLIELTNNRRKRLCKSQSLFLGLRFAFWWGVQYQKNQPEPPPVPVPTPQIVGGAVKQNPSSEKKYSSIGAQKPEESVDKDEKTEKEPPPEDPTTDIDQVSSKLDQLKSTDEEIQQKLNQLTLQILQNKLGEAEKTLDELKNKNHSLKTDVNTFENRPLIKRIKELQEQIDSLNRELQAKRQREQEELLQIAELEEQVSRRRKPLSKKKPKVKKKRKVVPSVKTKKPPKKTRRPSPKKVVPSGTKKPPKKKPVPRHIPKPQKPTWRIGTGRIIVVSLSNTFGGQQKTIRNGFFEVLTAKKGQSRSFTLYTIQSGRQSSTLLTSSQLRRLPKEGSSHSILGKLESGMRFGAADLWALGDLSNLIGKKRTQIGKVLYITDNKRINSANQKQLDILLKWKKAGGRLQVLTTGSCSVWQQVGATCSNISNLKGTLRGFI